MMAKDEGSEAMTTLSARFTEAELQSLKRAAESKQWSLSQLIRAGAHEKAVNIINARSTAAFTIRRLLGRVAEQLFKPKVMMSHDEFGPQEFDETTFHPDCSVYSSSLDTTDGIVLGEAMRRLGGELASMFDDELVRAGVYQVKDQLLDPSAPLVDSEAAGEQPANKPAVTLKKKPTRGRKG